MKKFTLLAAMLLLFAGGLHAQSVKFGARVGLNMATLTNDEDFIGEGVDKGLKLGFTGAGVVNIGISEMFAIQPEVQFSQKGLRTSSENETAGVTTETSSAATNNYLQVPVLAQLRFGDDTKILLNVGPYFGYWLSGSSKTEVTIDGDTETETDSYEFTDEGPVQDNRTEVGLQVGGGVELPMDFGAIVIDVRAGFGLTGLQKYEDDAPDDINNPRNLAIGISAGILFGGE